MVINDIEIKKGDCICGCAIDYNGYHYLEAFAIKVDKIHNNIIEGIFHGASYDDGVINYYCTNRSVENLKSTLGYNICIVDEKLFEQFVNYLQKKDIDEMDIWNYFRPIFDASIAKIIKYE